MIMMVFLSLYSIVDGIFIARFVGTMALSALNMVMPLVSFAMAIGIMVASGGSAIMAKLMGEGDLDRACRVLSFLVIVVVVAGIIAAIFGSLFLDGIIAFLGANADQTPYCETYLQILLIAAPFFLLQSAFQTFFVTAGRPGLGLGATVGAGVANIAFDYLFIVVFRMGIAGAALGTALGFLIPSGIGLGLFTFRRAGLRFARPEFNFRLLGKACGNGASEMVGNLAEGIITYLFNLQAMAFYGPDGVAAYTVVLYFEFVFTAVFYGYSSGIAPIISYKFGARDTAQLKSVFRSGILTIAIFGVCSFLLAQLVGPPLMTVFVAADTNVYAIAVNGFSVYSWAFLLMGLTYFSSALFTALSDGRTSATIAFSRSCVFVVGMLVLLPALLGSPGLWLAIPVAEALGAALSAFFIVRKRGVYGY